MKYRYSAFVIAEVAVDDALNEVAVGTALAAVEFAIGVVLYGLEATEDDALNGIGTVVRMQLMG